MPIASPPYDIFIWIVKDLPYPGKLSSFRDGVNEQAFREAAGRDKISACRNVCVMKTGRDNTMKDKILGGIIGLAVGDALGVPVEFETREALRSDPVLGMRAGRDTPPGTWSDDTSLTLCALDSLSNGLDYGDMMNRFLSWIDDAEYTPHGKSFGVGKTTLKALSRFAKGEPALSCGCRSESENGNGSLMRVLPLAFYLDAKYGDTFPAREDAVEIIHNVSALTHAHMISRVACGVYLSVAGHLIHGYAPGDAAAHGVRRALEYYDGKYPNEAANFRRLDLEGFKNLPEEEINSGGYVIDTLEASVWCLLNTDGYESCVLKAVNLGGDADTTGAVTGGLAGIYYGLDGIPRKWRDGIARLSFIERLCDKFSLSLTA
ncbi:MAG: ADP-ribosylglycohydrolase family protein [Synergistaceae bacterium]|jgi:ADP-ribosylglycohydrolase|nr:ADP-ribosylglycohydrolase family protein [Synergistaceae bacterium]